MFRVRKIVLNGCQAIEMFVFLFDSCRCSIVRKGRNLPLWVIGSISAAGNLDVIGLHLFPTPSPLIHRFHVI